MVEQQEEGESADGDHAKDDRSEQFIPVSGDGLTVSHPGESSDKNQQVNESPTDYGDGRQGSWCGLSAFLLFLLFYAAHDAGAKRLVRFLYHACHKLAGELIQLGI